MAPPFDRKALETMKRTELQRLCKHYGVKANLKSEALIDLLVETQQPPERKPYIRSTSTRRSSQAGTSRLSSIVIHNADGYIRRKQGDSAVVESVPNSAPRASRSRKIKQQTRLGVGRPKAAGGAGAREITGSSNSTLSKALVNRVPLTASLEETIEEIECAGQYFSGQNVGEMSNKNAPAAGSSLIALETVDKHVADAIRPLYEQINSFRSELGLISTLKNDARLLAAQTDEICSLREKLEQLTNLVSDLRSQAASCSILEMEFRQLKDSLLSNPAVPGRDSQLATAANSSIPLNQMSASSETCAERGAAILGKRQRAAPLSGDNGVEESNRTCNNTETRQEKRAKMSTPSNVEHSDPRLFDNDNDNRPCISQPHPDDATNLDGLNHPDNILSTLMPAKSDTEDTRSTSSISNSQKDHQPFCVSHHPTPSDACLRPSFPYPEAPQSPSPTRLPQPVMPQIRTNRPNPFHIFGFPPTGRVSRTARLHDSETEKDNLNESDARIADSNEDETLTFERSSETLPMKQTMYGTELEGDTRFGDYGMEGVSSGVPGFWAGGRV